jgi:hypothetical protein
MTGKKDLRLMVNEPRKRKLSLAYGSRRRPRCPDICDVAFGRKLVAYLGGDPTAIKDRWCWSDFAREYRKLRSGAERYFATARTGNPALAAYYLVHHWGSDPAWAEGVVERARTGDPAWAAYCLVWDCHSDRAWAEGVVERARTGELALAAYSLVRDCGSDRAWAEGVVERARTGNPALAAHYLVQYCGSDRAWAERVLERARTRSDDRKTGAASNGQ